MQFDNLSSFKSIPWTIELIERFKEDWTWLSKDYWLEITVY